MLCFQLLYHCPYSHLYTLTTHDTAYRVTQALDLQSDSSSSSSSSSEVEKGGEREERNELLAYKEVTARIRSGKAVDAFALSALFR